MMQRRPSRRATIGLAVWHSPWACFRPAARQHLSINRIRQHYLRSPPGGERGHTPEAYGACRRALHACARIQRALSGHRDARTPHDQVKLMKSLLVARSNVSTYSPARSWVSRFRLCGDISTPARHAQQRCRVSAAAALEDKICRRRTQAERAGSARFFA